MEEKVQKRLPGHRIFQSFLKMAMTDVKIGWGRTKQIHTAGNQASRKSSKDSSYQQYVRNGLRKVE